MGANRALPPLLEDSDMGVAVCTRRLGASDCGALAKYHIIWTEDAENGRACEEHAMEAIRRWEPIQVHALGHACTKEGALWIPEEKRCVFPEDEIDYAALQADLEELERTDPNVSRAAEEYDRTVRRLLETRP